MPPRKVLLNIYIGKYTRYKKSCPNYRLKSANPDSVFKNFALRGIQIRNFGQGNRHFWALKSANFGQTLR